LPSKANLNTIFKKKGFMDPLTIKIYLESFENRADDFDAEEEKKEEIEAATQIVLNRLSSFGNRIKSIKC
jgi:hypothetical protein